MCGIAGFTLGQQAATDEHRVTTQNMLRQMAYRGPDQQGVALLDGIALGHNRLTIMAPEGGTQPRLHQQCGLVYNGEIYGYRAFDQDIVSAGGQLRDHCDTESVFWLITLFGIEQALRRMDGMFAFAYYQAQTQTLYLARDVFGQKPLFYAHVHGQLIFASEIKALRQHPALASVTPDQQALRLYLMMEYVPWPASGMHEIQVLPPGHVLRYQHGQVQISPYWRVPTRQSAMHAPSAVEQLDQRLNHAVQQQLVADVPVGIFLSGGLDSSLIAAMAKQHHSDVSTFTIQFPQSSFDESAYAEEVAALLGTQHTTIALDRQTCVDGIVALVEGIDQPFADSSQLPTYLLCQATKQHVCVALGGDGADELFLGYPNFKMLRFAALLATLPAGLGRFVRTLIGRLPQVEGYMNWPFLLRQLSYGFGKPANAQSLYWMSAVSPGEQARLWIQGEGIEQALSEGIAEQMSQPEAPLMTQCQQHFLTQYLSQDILQKTDRASMQHSFEVRSPFLTTHVADYALTLPHASLMKRLQGKHILKQVACAYLPKNIVFRKKHGFASPVSVLIKQDFREVVEAVLMDKTNPMYAYLHFDQVNLYWQQHVLGHRDLGKSIWSLFMLAAFFNNQF